MDTGGGPLHLLGIYAPCGAGRLDIGGNACDALVKLALQRAAEIGQVPCMLAGDFNQDPLPSLSAAALALAGWRDLAADLGPTTRPGGGRRGRRINRVYANAAAASWVRSVRVCWDTGIATHAAVVVGLSVGRSPPTLCRVRPAPLAGLPAPGWSAGPALAAADADWEFRRREFERAVATNDVDQAWALLNGAALQFLQHRAASPKARRGAPQATFNRAALAPDDPDGYAVARGCQRRLAAVRACSAADRECGSGPLTPAAVALLRSAQAAAADAGSDEWAALLSAATTDRATLAAAALRLAEDYRLLACEGRSTRRERWHAFVASDLARGGRRCPLA